jgi:hypothetical protein
VGAIAIAAASKGATMKVLQATLYIAGFVVLECATVLGLFQVLNPNELACGLWFFVLFGFLRHVRRNRYAIHNCVAVATFTKVLDGPEFTAAQRALCVNAIAANFTALRLPH